MARLPLRADQSALSVSSLGGGHFFDARPNELIRLT